MILSAEHLSKNYGMKQLLSDVSLYLNERDKIGIIGVNGTGKSTLLKILAGLEPADEGNIAVHPGVRIAYLPQNPEMDDGLTVLEQVLAGFSPEFREQNGYEAKAMLNKLGITDFDAKIGTLSGGQRKRAALAAALLRPADVLILDEPTNHLDSEMVQWLEQRLCRFTGGLIMVTHDRWFLERVVNHITELYHTKLYNYEANYSRYLELKAQRAEMDEASERKRQAILRREYQWIMRGARARGTKSRDRIERYEALRDKDAPGTDETVKMAAAGSRLGRKIIELSGVSKAFDGRTVLRDFSYNLLRDDRIGVVGRNGAGKSTLLNLIAGRLEPDAGTIEAGQTVKVGYFMQECRELDPDRRVYDFISEIAAEVKTDEGTFTASQMLERFLFDADMQYTLIGRLSGGERRRLYLLSVLMAAPNVLLLDEPTNDLDIETLTILEDYLESFPGAVIAVSHDRWFLDKVADSIFEVGGDGEVRCWPGNFTEYWSKRQDASTGSKQEAAAEAGKQAAKKDGGEKAAAPAREIKPRRLKFTFKEEREFETIDADIAGVEADIAACETEIAEAASDYMRLQELTAKKQALVAELDAKTERWVYLNELAEKIEAQ